MGYLLALILAEIRLSKFEINIINKIFYRYYYLTYEDDIFMIIAVKVTERTLLDYFNSLENNLNYTRRQRWTGS